MEEKIYKTMSSTGAANLAIGICVLVGGIVSGILLIVNGAIPLQWDNGWAAEYG